MAITGGFYNVPDGTSRQANVPGALFEGDAEIILDTYVTNGLTVANLCAPLALRTIIHFLPVGVGPSLTAVVTGFSFDRVNGKVKLYAGSTEVSNGTDISAFKLYAKVSGRR